MVQGLPSIKSWRQSFRFLHYPFVVVVFDVSDDRLLELVQRLEFVLVAVEHLVLHDPEEVLHGRVVEAIPFPGHRLPDAPLFQLLMIGFHLVLPSLVAVEDQPLQVPVLGEGFPQHVERLGEIGAPRHVERDDLAIVHVQDRGEVQFAGGYVELGYVGRPFLVSRGGREIPLVSRFVLFLVDDLVQEQVLAGPVLVALVGVVLPSGRDAADPELRHDPLDLLVVGLIPPIRQFEKDPPVAVSPFVPMVYLLDLLDDLPVFLVFVGFVDRVEERRLFDPGDLEKDAGLV